MSVKLLNKFSKFVKKDGTMNIMELKKNFHRLIDSIDNESLLRNFYDFIQTKTRTKDGELWGRLNEDEQKELLLAFEESEDPDNLIDNAGIEKKHRKWLSR